MPRPAVWGFLTLALIFATAIPAVSQSLFERLVMPGNLASAHSELQTDCANCHSSFRQGAQSDLCLDCHKEIRQDTIRSEGYHGKSTEVGANECSHCHTDHEGQDARIVLFDFETFDHDLTDFALLGSHLQAPCEACHDISKPFRQADSKCVDCHVEDDPHDDEFGKQCSDCHAPVDWTTVSGFDHSKTNFPLVGAHAKADCDGCHIGGSYKGLQTSCVSCHALDDRHENRFGSKCGDCHLSVDWTSVRFDHDRDTDFTLSGAHKKAACESCHIGNVSTHPMQTNCVDCHKSDDVHLGSLGQECKGCHGVENWFSQITFDHDFTDFPLIGLHATAPCEACHFDTTFQKSRFGCVDCHEGEDKHKKTLGPECTDCHNPTGWASWIFDHDLDTGFRLTGAHAPLSCDKCHRQPTDQRPTLPGRCIDCHRSDDKHEGAFGTDCTRCHSTARFTGAKLR